MNALLVIWLLYSSVSAHDSGQGWQRPNGRPSGIPPNAQDYHAFHSTAPPVQHEYTKYSNPLTWTQESELWEQRQSGTPEAQCPCVIRPDTNMCITYDSRFQAATLAEGVFGFPDLSLNIQQQKGAPANTAVAGSNAMECDTAECQLCASRMAQKLRDVGLMNGAAPGLQNFTSASSQDYCQSYRFDHPKLPSNQTPSIHISTSKESAAVKSDVNRLIQMGHEYYQKTQKNATSSNGKPVTGRGKRQTDNSTAILGTRFNISCVRKGEIDLVGGDRMMSLCTSCWAWRRLPDNYFPQYISELICDTQDAVCLSGWATCSQAYRTLNVLRQQPNGTWDPVTIQAGSCCECKVQAGSALNSLVVGLGMSTSLSASPSP